MENGLTHVLVKSETPGDPIHVNDIEPVLHDGPYFKRGDLFISARNGSWIMHYPTLLPAKLFASLRALSTASMMWTLNPTAPSPFSTTTASRMSGPTPSKVAHERARVL